MHVFLNNCFVVTFQKFFLQYMKHRITSWGKWNWITRQTHLWPPRVHCSTVEVEKKTPWNIFPSGWNDRNVYCISPPSLSRMLLHLVGRTHISLEISLRESTITRERVSILPLSSHFLTCFRIQSILWSTNQPALVQVCFLLFSIPFCGALNEGRSHGTTSQLFSRWNLCLMLWKLCSLSLWQKIFRGFALASLLLLFGVSVTITKREREREREWEWVRERESCQHPASFIYSHWLFNGRSELSALRPLHFHLFLFLSLSLLGEERMAICASVGEGERAFLGWPPGLTRKVFPCILRSIAWEGENGFFFCEI